MAFSLRKMLSNINYFTKPGEEENPEIGGSNGLAGGNPRLDRVPSISSLENFKFDEVEADFTSISATSLKLPESVKDYSAKKGSLSDTDLLRVNVGGATKKDRKKCRKLKVDIEKASQSMNDSVDHSEDSSLNVENTPKHKHLDFNNPEVFVGFNFNQCFDKSDASSSEEEMDIQSLSDNSDTDLSGENDDAVDIKMCRKVDCLSQIELVPSTSPESLADIEVCVNNVERIKRLLYISKELDRVKLWIMSLLKELSQLYPLKVSNRMSTNNALPQMDFANNPNALLISYNDDIEQCISPTGWNIVTEKDSRALQKKLKEQLVEMRNSIDKFINMHFDDHKPKRKNKSKTFGLHNGRKTFKTTEPSDPPNPSRMSYKKKLNFDYPDLRDAFLNLFSDENLDVSETDVDDTKCSCQCHLPTESELTTKSDKDTPNQSITSSIGNFTLDSTTLSAYSESLDQIVSYNSFNDTNNNSLYNTLLQKPAIERITFYIQVHSIQLKCEPTDMDFESKNAITFHCPTCKTTEYEENGLLKHILSSNHCEKIHFVYKTAYVKKCISAGKEIQPSTVLNPMTIYRDDNKIVCFGEALYACSLCFENLIIGESVLMSHCSDEEHVNRRVMLAEIFE